VQFTVSATAAGAIITEQSAEKMAREQQRDTMSSGRADQPSLAVKG
jgi:hypothetical protein